MDTSAALGGVEIQDVDAEHGRMPTVPAVYQDVSSLDAAMITRTTVGVVLGGGHCPQVDGSVLGPATVDAAPSA
jgi:hypothetical protein